MQRLLLRWGCTWAQGAQSQEVRQVLHLKGGKNLLELHMLMSETLARAMLLSVPTEHILGPGSAACCTVHSAQVLTGFTVESPSFPLV